MRPLLATFLQKQRIKAAKPYLKGKNILDLGCGEGRLIPLFLPNQKYTGVDSNPETIAQMKLKYPKLTFICNNIEDENLVLEDSFDTVILLAILEHLANPDRPISTLRHYLKPDGQIVVTTPTKLGNFIHKIGSRLGLFYIEAALDHKYIYDRKQLEQLFSKHGFFIVVYKKFLFGGNQLCVVAKKE